jgi:hypothetical protein
MKSFAGAARPRKTPSRVNESKASQRDGNVLHEEEPGRPLPQNKGFFLPHDVLPSDM